MVADTTLFSLPTHRLEIGASGAQKVPATVCLPQQLSERKVQGQAMTPVLQDSASTMPTESG